MFPISMQAKLIKSQIPSTTSNLAEVPEYEAASYSSIDPDNKCQKCASTAPALQAIPKNARALIKNTAVHHKHRQSRHAKRNALIRSRTPSQMTKRTAWLCQTILLTKKPPNQSLPPGDSMAVGPLSPLLTIVVSSRWAHHLSHTGYDLAVCYGFREWIVVQFNIMCKGVGPCIGTGCAVAWSTYITPAWLWRDRMWGFVSNKSRKVRLIILVQLIIEDSKLHGHMRGIS